MSAPILPLFSKLWSADASTRIESSSQLVSHLLAAKEAAAANADQPESSASSAAVEEDVSYTIKRLVRGLASPRESSRLGFAVALTELFSRYPGLSTFTVLPIVLSSSQLPAGVKGSEERDILFARLFGFYALVSSSLLFSSSPNISSLHSFRTVVEETLYLGERKNWLRESAGWVVLQATKQLISKSKEQLEWRDEGLQLVITAALDSKKSIRDEGKRVAAKDFWTPEKIALVVLLQEAEVPVEWNTILSPSFPSPASLLSSSANLPALSRILRGLSSSDGPNSNGSARANGKKGSASHENASTALLGSNGQLHYVWRTIFESYFSAKDNLSSLRVGGEQPKKKKTKVAQDDRKDNRMPFNEFFRATIDDSLLSTSSSLSSKYTGLLALTVLLPVVSSTDLPLLFTPNLTRLLINHLHKKDRTLHSVCLQVTQAIPLAVARNPSAGYDVLMRIFDHGDIRLDSITRTKTVEGVVAALDEQGRRRYTQWLQQYLLSGAAAEQEKTEDGEDENEEEDESMKVDADANGETSTSTSQENKQKTLEAKRIWALDQLLLLVKKHTTSASASSSEEVPEWVSSVLQLLVLHGYFAVIKSTKKSTISALHQELPSPALGQNVQAGCRSRLVSILTHLVNISSKTKGEIWVRETIDCFKTLEEKEKKSVELLSSTVEGDSQQRKSERKATWSIIQRLRESPDASRAQPMLFIASVLLLMAYDPSEEEPVLEELRDAIDALFPSDFSTGKPANGAQEDEEEEGEAAEPISILIDLLVSLLQRPSVLLRTVAERVFAAYSGEVKEQAFGLLLDQIIPEEQIEVEGEDEDEEEDDDEDDVSNEAGLAVNGSKNSKKGKAVAEAASDDEEDEDSDEESDDDDEDLDIDLDADPELRAKVEAALRSAGIAESDNDEDDDDDDEAEEEELLDDEAMMELDSQLAEIFKAKKAASRETKDVQENSLNSRLKVLDLLEIYAKQQPANPLLLKAVLPLFDCARRSSGNEENELVAKAGKVLRNIISKPKEYPTVSDDAQSLDELLETLTTVHGVLRKTASSEASALGNLTSAYLSRTILTETGTRRSTDVCDIYTATIFDYATRKASRVQPQLLATFVQRFKQASWLLQEPLLQVCNGTVPAKDSFRRMALFGVLGELLTSHASLKTDKACKAILDVMPSIVDAVLKVFNAAISGTDSKLQAARLRELFKFANTAVRVTKNAASATSSSPARVAEIWRAEELCSTLAKLAAPSSKVKNASGLNTSARSLVDQVLQGTGRAKCRDIAKGLPPMLPTNGDGKPMDKMALRKEKKEAQKQAQATKAQAKKRKAGEMVKPQNGDEQSSDESDS